MTTDRDRLQAESARLEAEIAQSRRRWPRPLSTVAPWIGDFPGQCTAIFFPARFGDAIIVFASRYATYDRNVFP